MAPFCKLIYEMTLILMYTRVLCVYCKLHFDNHSLRNTAMHEASLIRLNSLLTDTKYRTICNPNPKNKILRSLNYRFLNPGSRD